jgi:hypothetical protein
MPEPGKRLEAAVGQHSRAGREAAPLGKGARRLPPGLRVEQFHAQVVAAHPEFIGAGVLHGSALAGEGTRPVGGKTALLFGIDGIARYDGEHESLNALFDHELFHAGEP